MISEENTFIKEDDFDDSIRQRMRIGNNSGYLEEQYEITKEFPILQEHHFRIEDQAQILNLEKLRRQSKPMIIQSTFSSSSEQFKTRLDNLLSCIDSRQVQIVDYLQSQKHGFYTLADHYDDDSFVNSMINQAKVEELRVQVDNFSLKDIKPVFIKKTMKSQKSETNNKDFKQLSKKFSKITISQQNL